MTTRLFPARRKPPHRDLERRSRRGTGPALTALHRTPGQNDGLAAKHSARNSTSGVGRLTLRGVTSNAAVPKGRTRTRSTPRPCPFTSGSWCGAWSREYRPHRPLPRARPIHPPPRARLEAHAGGSGADAGGSFSSRSRTSFRKSASRLRYRASSSGHARISLRTRRSCLLRTSTSRACLSLSTPGHR